MTDENNAQQTGNADILGPCPMGLQHPGFTLIEGLPSRVDELEETVEGKQDTLTAGENITIEGNVISAQGGGTGVLEFIDNFDDLQVGDKLRVWACGYCNQYPGTVSQTDVVVSECKGYTPSSDTYGQGRLCFTIPNPTGYWRSPWLTIMSGSPYDPDVDAPYGIWFDYDREEAMVGAGGDEANFAEHLELYHYDCLEQLMEVIDPACTTGFFLNADTSDSDPCLYFAVAKLS